MKNYSNNLSGLTETEKKAVQELVGKLKEFYGNNLSRLILYGSKARGDSEPGADIDILVVLKKMGPRDREIEKIVEITSPLCLKYNVLISALPKQEDKVNAPYKTIFIHNVLQEGVEL